MADTQTHGNPIVARPPQPKTETVANLSIGNGPIRVTFAEKRESFRAVVKRLDLVWRPPSWVRVVPADALPHRAAELARALLEAGFIVRADAGIIQAAASGAFTPEPRRWLSVGAGQYHGWFYLGWKRDQDCYDLARTLPGSRYDSPGIAVPAEHYETVLDFAGLYGFTLTPAAQRLADAARAERERAITVQIAPMPAAPPPPAYPTGKPPALVVPADVPILTELLDGEP